MPKEEWFRIMELYRALGVTHVTFTGGEPTMRDDILDLVRHAQNTGFTVGLITNGRNADRGFLKRLSAIKGLFLSISVPGLTTFREHTGVDNIDHVLGLFDIANEFGLPTTANIAVTKKNLPELYENIAYPLLHGARYVLLNRFLPGGRGLYNKEYLLTVDEINRMLDTAEEVLAVSGATGHVGTELPYCIIKNPGRYKRLQIASTCAAAKGFFVTDSGGYIKVCNHSPTRICHWTQSPRIETFDYWNAFLHGGDGKGKTSYLPKMCDFCEKRGRICDGGCREAAHVYHGAINDPDPCFDCVT